MPKKPFEHELYIPEHDTSGEEVIETKTQQRLYGEQILLWSVFLIPIIVGTMITLAADTWIEKLAYGGLMIAASMGFLGYMIIGAMKEAEGKIVHLPESYKKLDEYSEILIEEECHLISMPITELNIKPFQDDYLLQTDKFIIEHELIADLEGKVLVSATKDFEKDGYVVMPPSKYKALSNEVAKCYKDLETFREAHDLRRKLPRPFKWLADALWKWRFGTIQENLLVSTQPKRWSTTKLFEKVRSYLDDQYRN